MRHVLVFCYYTIIKLRHVLVFLLLHCNNNDVCCSCVVI